MGTGVHRKHGNKDCLFFKIKPPLQSANAAFIYLSLNIKKKNLILALRIEFFFVYLHHNMIYNLGYVISKKLCDEYYKYYRCTETILINPIYRPKRTKPKGYLKNAYKRK